MGSSWDLEVIVLSCVFAALVALKCMSLEFAVSP